MQKSGTTHSTAAPFGYFKLDEINSAADRACASVVSSSDSRTPRRRPSMMGRMPIFGNLPFQQLNLDVVFLIAIRGSNMIEFPRFAILNGKNRQLYFALQAGDIFLMFIPNGCVIISG
jgi:hypothetical protein